MQFRINIKLFVAVSVLQRLLWGQLNLQDALLHQLAAAPIIRCQWHSQIEETCGEKAFLKRSTFNKKNYIKRQKCMMQEHFPKKCHLPFAWRGLLWVCNFHPWFVPMLFSKKDPLIFVSFMKYASWKYFQWFYNEHEFKPWDHHLFITWLGLWYKHAIVPLIWSWNMVLVLFHFQARSIQAVCLWQRTVFGFNYKGELRGYSLPTFLI